MTQNNSLVDFLKTPFVLTLRVSGAVTYAPEYFEQQKRLSAGPSKP